ncbi:glycosyltransferase [Rufibacter immobilis]|uniref:Glycosyltransferase n=1 Tax=Rufibacter immobilis TaxID=1348778 RepID=A0A3M9MTG9_9BACT|nr:glycosyltransferase [Rufibacter immobilis]RNI28028.1 glycosyltransferase [Rufibacter immobilis]
MTPKVSVCMITYNHAAYIAQAIEGVLMQKTDFTVELVIGEDCSTDATRSIISAYQKAYPDKIKLLLPEHNLGMMKNFLNTLSACDGEYVAFCDGDDYWTEPLKLQKQVDFLDSHPDFAISFHRALILHESTGQTEFSNKGQKSVSSVTDLFKENFICTTTTVYRNRPFSYYPTFLEQAAVGDWTLHVLNAATGKIGFMEDTMAAYRLHQGGTMASTNASYAKLKTMLHQNIKTFASLDTFLHYKYHKEIKELIAGFYKHLVISNLREKQKAASVKNCLQMLKNRPVIKSAALLLLVIFAPSTTALHLLQRPSSDQ